MTHCLNVPCIVCGGSLLVFLLICVNVCPIEYFKHQRAGWFSLIFLLLSCDW